MEWFINNIELIILIIYAIASILVYIFTGKRSSNKTNALLEIYQKIKDWIKLAENIAELDGEERKTYVMSQVDLTIKARNVKLTEEEYSHISLIIDAMVKLSKEINRELKSHESLSTSKSVQPATDSTVTSDSQVTPNSTLTIPTQEVKQ